MRAFNYLLCAFVLGLIVSCVTDGKDKKKAKSLTDPMELVFPLEIQKGGDFKSVAEIRLQALSMIRNRIEIDPEPLSMITYGYLVPEAVFNGKAMSRKDAYLGHWIDFKEDFTYEYGCFEKTFGGGEYHLRLDDGILLMLNNDESYEPKTFTLNSNSEAFALVGQHDFGVNNGMQIKMLPSDTKPKK